MARLHLHRLHFDKLGQSFFTPLATIARLFVATKRRLIVERPAIDDNCPARICRPSPSARSVLPAHTPLDKPNGESLAI